MGRQDVRRGAGGVRAMGVRGCLPGTDCPGEHRVPGGRHSAATARDDGIRRIGGLTWRAGAAGAAGAACSALIAIAFGHHGATRRPANGGNPDRARS